MAVAGGVALDSVVEQHHRRNRRRHHPDHHDEPHQQQVECQRQRPVGEARRHHGHVVHAHVRHRAHVHRGHAARLAQQPRPGEGGDDEEREENDRLLAPQRPCEHRRRAQ